MNDESQWGDHPLVLTMANTREMLYLANCSGSRPSHESAFVYFQLSIDLCPRVGFRVIRPRRDADFFQSGHRERWDAECVELCSAWTRC